MTFEEILSSGNYHLIDVRQPEELVMEGKVEGAINIPLATVPLKIDEIKEEIGMVIEGLDALKIAYNISQKYNINTKIINTLYDIIYSEKNKESIIDAVLN